MKQSTWLFVLAAFVAVVWWLRKTIVETADTVIGDITSNFTTTPATDEALVTSLEEPKVTNTLRLKDNIYAFFREDGTVIYRQLPTEGAPYDTILLPPIGFDSKP